MTYAHLDIFFRNIYLGFIVYQFILIITILIYINEIHLFIHKNSQVIIPKLLFFKLDKIEHRKNIYSSQMGL